MGCYFAPKNMAVLRRENLIVRLIDQQTNWAWIILGTCFVNLFTNYPVSLGYGIVLPDMIDDLGFSRTAGGSI